MLKIGKAVSFALKLCQIAREILQETIYIYIYELQKNLVEILTGTITDWYSVDVDNHC